MSTPILWGWDASHYDAPPNADKLISEGFSFMTHKLGGDGNDPEAADWWHAVKPRRAVKIAFDQNGVPYFADANGKRGVVPGGYWIVRPDLHSNPSADADQFIARLNSQCPGWSDGWWIFQADCESWGDSSGRKKPNKAHIKAFCDRLKAKYPKLRTLVYASKGDYGDNLTGLGYPLWNARYSVNYKTGTAYGLYQQALAAGSGWAKYSGQVPAIWQFTSSATIAGQTTCDANAFQGTPQQFISLVAPGWAQNIQEDDVQLTDPLYGKGDNTTDNPHRTVGDVLKDTAKTDGVLRGAFDYKKAGFAPTAPIVQLLQLPGTVTKMAAAIQAIGDKVGVSTAELKAAIDQVDDQVVAKLQGSTVEDTAQLLLSLLGDKADEVAQAILAASQGSAPTA